MMVYRSCAVTPAALFLLLFLMISWSRPTGASFFLKVVTRRSSSRSNFLSRFASPPSPPSRAKTLEVEQKFVLSRNPDAAAAMERKLQDLGLVKKREMVMIDWYFDTATQPPLLSPLDHWLRYRELSSGGTTAEEATKAKGQWQLKRGKQLDQQQQNDNHSTSHGGTAATVYEEVEGLEAIDESLRMLAKACFAPVTTSATTTSKTEYEGFQVPQLPYPNCGLVPFARIETQRSSWTLVGEELTVDLDATNTGCLVGEAEIVVEQEHEIPAARQKIENFLELLQLDEAMGPPMGKLEDYLIKHRPDHYQACVDGGSIVEKRQTK